MGSPGAPTLWGMAPEGLPHGYRDGPDGLCRSPMKELEATALMVVVFTDPVWH